MSIVIALVAENNGRITEIAEVSGKPLKTANLIIRKFEPTVDEHKCFEEGGFYFCVLSTNGTVYLCASASSNQRICFQFLETIKNEYEERQYVDKEDLGRFEDFIEDQMDIFSNHPEKVDKIKGVQAKVDQVREIQMSNLSKLLEREGRLEHMQESTSHLQEESGKFQRMSNSLKCVKWRQNIIVTIVLIFCCLILLGIIIGIVYYVVTQK